MSSTKTFPETRVGVGVTAMIRDLRRDWCSCANPCRIPHRFRAEPRLGRSQFPIQINAAAAAPTGQGLRRCADFMSRSRHGIGLGLVQVPGNEDCESLGLWSSTRLCWMYRRRRRPLTRIFMRLRGVSYPGSGLFFLANPPRFSNPAAANRDCASAAAA